MKILDLDFYKEFLKEYSEDDLNKVEKLVYNALENWKSTSLYDDPWNISVSVEKIHELQYIYHLNIYNDNNEDLDIYIEVENGINNGTVLLDYSFEGGSCPSTRYQDVLSDLELDWSSMDQRVNKTVASMVFEKHKKDILEIHRKQSYDNYVTGGGTINTHKHYKNSFQKYYDMGLRWECVYKSIEVDTRLR